MKLSSLLKDPSLLQTQCFINGEWTDADQGSTTTVINPADGSETGCVPLAGAAETKRAIHAAELAWHVWREHTAEYRGGLLRKWFDLIIEHQEDLSIILTSEQTPCRGSWRNSLRGLLYFLVCRGGQACLW